MICTANHLADFYMRKTLALNGLTNSLKLFTILAIPTLNLSSRNVLINSLSDRALLINIFNIIDGCWYFRLNITAGFFWYFNKWLLRNRQVRSVLKLINAIRYVTNLWYIENLWFNSSISKFVKFFLKIYSLYYSLYIYIYIYIYIYLCI